MTNKKQTFYRYREYKSYFIMFHFLVLTSSRCEHTLFHTLEPATPIYVSLYTYIDRFFGVVVPVVVMVVSDILVVSFVFSPNKPGSKPHEGDRTRVWGMCGWNFYNDDISHFTNQQQQRPTPSSFGTSTAVVV